MIQASYAQVLLHFFETLLWFITENKIKKLKAYSQRINYEVL